MTTTSPSPFLAGSLVGTALGLLSLAALGRFAPSFFSPALPAAAAVLGAHVLLGALVGLAAGATLGRGDERRARAAATACPVAAYGAIVGVLAVLYVRANPGALLLALSVPAGAGLFAFAARLARGRPWRGALLLVAVCAALLPAPWHARGTRPGAAPPASGRLVVVGLDGGTWRVLTPLLEARELPAVARMIREGASGPLWSFEQSLSPVVWTSIATGKTPEKHGVHDFYATQNTHLQGARFWEVAAARGRSVGIFRWLVTWPPDQLTGFVVPGWLARDPRTVPDDLRFLKELELAFQERRSLSPLTAAHLGLHALHGGVRFATVTEIARGALEAWRLDDARAWYRAGKMAQHALHADVFLASYRRFRPEVAAVVFYGSDALAHTFWKYHEPAAFRGVPARDVALYGETIRDCYRRFDRFLARLLTTVDPETTVFLVSDHGFTAGEQDASYSLRTQGLLRALGEEGAFHAHAIASRVFLIPKDAGSPRAASDATRAAAKLAALRYDGAPLVNAAVTREGVTVKLRGRSMALDLGRPIDTPTGAQPLSALVTATTWSGTHERRGILIARGPEIRRGAHIEDASLLDVAPTLLHLLGYPVSARMDGHVLTAMLTVSRPVQTVASYDDAVPARGAGASTDAAVEERLRALGYVR